MKIFAAGVLVLVTANLTFTQSAREERVAGASAKADLRVQVHLDNGSLIKGIALKGRLIERQSRGHFHEETDETVRSAGIRVWYYRDMDGFMFVPYRRVKEVVVLGEVSGKDLEALRGAFNIALEDRRARSHAASAKSADAEAISLDDVELSDDERRLLTDYPVGDGWGAARFGDLQRRRIVGEEELSKSELGFIDQFPAWKAAVEKARALTKAKEEATEKKDGPVSEKLEPIPDRKARGFKGSGGGVGFGGNG